MVPSIKDILCFKDISEKGVKCGNGYMDIVRFGLN